MAVADAERVTAVLVAETVASDAATAVSASELTVSALETVVRTSETAVAALETIVLVSETVAFRTFVPVKSTLSFLFNATTRNTVPLVFFVFLQQHDFKEEECTVILR